MNRLALFRSETHNKYATFCEIVEHGKDTRQENITVQSFYSNEHNLLPQTGDNNRTIESFCLDKVDAIAFSYMGILGFVQTLDLTLFAYISQVCNKKIILISLTGSSLAGLLTILFFQNTDFAAYSPCLVVILTGTIVPIINSVVVELFPTNLRGMAACLTLMCCRIGTVSTNVVAGSLIDRHCEAFISSFVVAMAICLITVGIMPTRLQERKQFNTRL